MILTGHQPVYLPWLGLFHKIALADTFVFMDQVQYLAGDWNNRNYIKTPQGKLLLTVPVSLKQGESLLLSDIVITQDSPRPERRWQARHWKSIQLNYQHAPYFSQYADFFRWLYMEKEWTRLSELNEAMLRYLLDVLGIKVRFLRMSDCQFQGKKADLILDMCRQLGATINVFGALGRDYVDSQAFEREGIQVYFQDYRHRQYPQQFGPFVSHLSVVDLLFNCGPGSLEVVMEGNVSKSALLTALETARSVG